MNDIPDNDNTPIVTVPVIFQKPVTPMVADPHNLSALAREVATNIKPRTQILEEFGLTEERFKEIETIPYFKNAVDAYATEWNAPANTAKRIGIKASMLIEDSLPDIGGRMVDRAEPLRDAVEAAKFLAKLGNLGEEKGAMGAGEQVKITINIGNQSLVFDKTPEVQPLAEGEQPIIDLQPEPQGGSAMVEIRPEPAGASTEEKK
jgi:hypothetical protein